MAASPRTQLLSSLWKLDRAEMLLTEMRQGGVVLAAAPGQAELVECEPISDAGGTWLIGWVEPAPFPFSAVVADFVHNLRASLDQLAWQLCGCPHPQRAHVAFPIRDKQQGTLRHINLMTPAAAAIVESLQPYRRAGREDPLFLLHDLWNQDKHRFTPLVSVQVWTHRALGAIGELPDHGSLAEAVKRKASSGVKLTEVTPHWRTLAFSALSDRRQRNLIVTSERLLAHVRDEVVPLFDRRDCFP